MRKDIEVLTDEINVTGQYGSGRNFLVEINDCNVGEILDQLDAYDVFDYIAQDLEAGQVVREINNEHILDEMDIDTIREYLAKNDQ